MIAQMLTDKKVIGLSVRGESITLQQQRYVSLFGKTSAAIIDSQSIFEACNNNERIKANKEEFTLTVVFTRACKKSFLSFTKKQRLLP